jgi:hypothetical protein
MERQRERERGRDEGREGGSVIGFCVMGVCGVYTALYVTMMLCTVFFSVLYTVTVLYVLCCLDTLYQVNTSALHCTVQYCTASYSTLLYSTFYDLNGYSHRNTAKSLQLRPKIYGLRHTAYGRIK